MARKLTAATGKSIFNNRAAAKHDRNPNAALSAETVQDSSSEGEQEDAAEASSSEDSSSTEEEESDSDIANEPQEEADTTESETEVEASQDKSQQRATTNGLKRKKVDETAGDRVSKQAEVPNKKARVEENQAGLNPSNTTSQTTSIPARHYIPPKGYQSMKNGGRTVIKTSSVRDKEVWHFSVPKDVPIASLSTIDPQAMQQGKVVLTHNHVQYTLIQSQSDYNIALLLPGDQGNGYECAVESVQRSYRLQPKLELPMIPSLAPSRMATADRGSAADISIAAVVAIKPQPKGLRMRFKLPGSGSQGLETIGSSSDEEEEQAQSTQPSFQFPRALGGGHAEGVNGTTSTVVQRLKKKKEVRLKEYQDKRSKSMIDHPPDSSQDTSQQSQQLNDDDRARRKAEKKRKKLAKQQMNELA